MNGAPEHVGDEFPREEIAYEDPRFCEQFIYATGQNPILNDGPVGFPTDDHHDYLGAPQELPYETGCPDLRPLPVPPHPIHSNAFEHDQHYSGNENHSLLSNDGFQHAIPLLPPALPTATDLEPWPEAALTHLFMQEGLFSNVMWPGTPSSDVAVLADNDAGHKGITTATFQLEARPHTIETIQVAADGHNVHVPIRPSQNDFSAIQGQDVVAGQIERPPKRKKGNSARKQSIAPPRQRPFPATHALQHATSAPGPGALRSQAVVNGNPEAYCNGQNSGLQPGPTSFPCLEDDCEQAFDTRAELQEHEEGHTWKHKHEYKCPIWERSPDLCNNKGLQKPADVNRHVLHHFPPQFHCQYGCGKRSYQYEHRVVHEKTCKSRLQQQGRMHARTTPRVESGLATPASHPRPSYGEVAELAQGTQSSMSRTGPVRTVHQFDITPSRPARFGRNFAAGQSGSTRAPRSAAPSSLAQSEPPAVFSTPPGQPLPTPPTNHTHAMFVPRTDRIYPSHDPNNPNHFSSPSLPK
ncbi:hypothetical protein LTR95_001533 [Oleoguttula sp. CCFEE 5521]